MACPDFNNVPDDICFQYHIMCVCLFVRDCLSLISYILLPFIFLLFEFLCVLLHISSTELQWTLNSSNAGRQDLPVYSFKSAKTYFAFSFQVQSFMIQNCLAWPMFMLSFGLHHISKFVRLLRKYFYQITTFQSFHNEQSQFTTFACVMFLEERLQKTWQLLVASFTKRKRK